jgi:Zn-finger nucleic acid-binding protein
MGILCPRCNLSLNELTKVGVSVDVCANCRGMWLDRGELEKLVVHVRNGERKNDPAAQYTEASAGIARRTGWPATGTPRDGILRCPRCATPLNGACQDGVRLDACGGCHGGWLDRGELERIKRRRWGLQHDGARDGEDAGKSIRWVHPVRHPRRHPLRGLLLSPALPPQPSRDRELLWVLLHRIQNGQGISRVVQLLARDGDGPNKSPHPLFITGGRRPARRAGKGDLVKEGRQAGIQRCGPIIVKMWTVCRPVAGTIVMGAGLLMMFVPVLPGTPLLLAGMAIAGSSHPVVRFLRERWNRWTKKGV